MRRIRAIEGDFHVRGDRGPVPELRWVRIGQMVVDETYQRPIAYQGRRTIREIVANFDWRMFSPVVVCPIESGLFAIVDGQHRATAALTCGIAEIPALVIQADTAAQARAFGAINGRVTQVSTQQRFKAALAAGDPEAMRLKRVADAAGVVIVYFNTAAINLKPNETVALDAIRRAVLRFGEDVATLALKAIGMSAGGEPGYFRAVTIATVAEVLGAHPDKCAREAQLLASFKDLDLEALRNFAAAEAHKLGEIGKVLFADAIAAHLAEQMQLEAAE